jgi:hypothetical protein
MSVGRVGRRGTGFPARNSSNPCGVNGQSERCGNAGSIGGVRTCPTLPQRFAAPEFWPDYAEMSVGRRAPASSRESNRGGRRWCR